MLFINNVTISTSEELTYFWKMHTEYFVEFPMFEVDSGNLEFKRPLDHFDLDADSAEKLKIIGQPYDFYDNTILKAIPDFEVTILSGINDKTGIGALLNRFTNVVRERSVYGINASFIFDNNSLYCALTICYVDKDYACELPTAILEISQDEKPYISPIVVNEEASNLFSSDEIHSVGEYLANIWFGIQYEMVNCPEEIRVVEQRGPIEPADSNNYSSKIVLVKKVIPVDECGNPIKYETKNSGRVFKKKAWNVRGHMRTLPDGRQVPVKAYPKGEYRNDPNAIDTKQYVFEDDKISEDAEKRKS